MKFISKITALISTYLLIAVPQMFANGEGSHPPGEKHNDAIAVDPLIIIIPAIVIGGFLLWKFVFHSPKSPSPTQSAQPEKPPTAQEKTVSQSSKKEVS